MVNCLIVDDEPLARQVLEAYITRTAELRLVGSCGRVTEAFDRLAKESVDLLLLDIQLPGMTGIDFIRQLKHPPALLFTTAYPQYAVESYELEAVDYLLKPITYERFSQGIDKVLRRSRLVSEPPCFTYFKVDGGLLRLEHYELLYAQSFRDYVLLKTPTRSVLVHLTMAQLSDMLPRAQFRRVHRSFLVNVEHISRLDKQSLQLSQQVIPIGEQFRINLGEFWAKLFRKD